MERRGPKVGVVDATRREVLDSSFLVPRGKAVLEKPLTGTVRRRSADETLIKAPIVTISIFGDIGYYPTAGSPLLTGGSNRFGLACFTRHPLLWVIQLKAVSCVS